MKNNLTARTVVIVATILICVFGIIGLPKSFAELKQNFSNNIRLGLDLKGGTHLVLQVQVQDAVKADAEQTAERLKDDLKKQNIAWGSMDVHERAEGGRRGQGRRSPSKAFRRNAVHGASATSSPSAIRPTSLTALNASDYSHETEADRPDRSEGGHGEALDGHDRQPH